VVPFPFSDLTASKVRPAVCLADAGRGDWILCQITSKPYGDPDIVSLDRGDFAAGGLQLASFARPGKLFTANRSLLTYSVGKLNPPASQRVIAAVVKLICPGASP
jgi:mRNA interferase MazF